MAVRRWLAGWRVPLGVLLLLAAAVYAMGVARKGHAFWDFRVYERGLRAYLRTGSPYHASEAFPFSYPPLPVVLVGAIVRHLSAQVWYAVLLCLHAASCVLVPRLLLPASVRLCSAEFLWQFGVFLVGFGLAGATMFISGNISGCLAVLYLGALLHAARRQSYTVFWLVLVLVCQIKIYLLCLAVVPVLLDRQVRGAVVASVAAVLLHACNFVLQPSLWRDYLATAESLVVIPGHVGSTPMSALVGVLKRTPGLGDGWIAPVALGVHAGFAVGVFAFAVVVMWGNREARRSECALAWALVAAFLLSPRLVKYDYAIIVIPLLGCAREVVRSRGPGLVMILVAAFVGTVFAHESILNLSSFVLALGVWLALGANWLTMASRPSAASSPERIVGTEGV